MNILQKVKFVSMLIIIFSALSVNADDNITAETDEVTVTEKAFFLDENGNKTKQYILPGDTVIVRDVDKKTNIASITYLPKGVDARIDGHTLAVRFSNSKPEKYNKPKKAVVSSAVAFFYGSPNSATLGRQYVIKGDLVHVLEFNNGFYRIKYKSKNKTIFVAWVKAGSLRFSKNHNKVKE